MTKEELLRPRYKVIADYPNRPMTMPIGHIITLDKFGGGKWWHEYTDAEPMHIDEGSNRFPHLFKKLEWWEDREVKDMPEYVRIEDKVIKVKKWISEDELWSEVLGITKTYIVDIGDQHNQNIIIGGKVIDKLKQQFSITRK